jgi:PAS domain S-box-containing protein
MGSLSRVISIVGARRVLVGLGGLYLVLAVGYAIFIAAVKPIGALVADAVLFIVPGIGLVYGGYRLPRTDIHSDAYPRVVVWCLRGIGIILGVIVVLELNPAGSVDREFYTPVVATALGSIGGFGVGINEARAITQSYETEQRNRELQRYETLIEEATDVNALLDPDGTFRYLTPSVEHVLGYTPDELVGEVAFEYMHPDDREAAMDAFAEMLESGGMSRTVVFRFKHADSGWVVLEGRGRNLLDDPVIDGIAAYTHDVTEREQLEDDLRQERDLRERIVETSPVGITVIDADGSISFANEHAAEIIGLPKDELIGREYDGPMFEATDADGEPVEEGIFEQVLATGEPVYDAERQVTHADGQRIWLSVNGAPLHDSSGEVTGVVFAAEDITERKEREAELELFRSLIDRSNDAVFVIDPGTGQFLDVNDTACRRLGYDREELMEMTVPDIEANLPDWDAWQAHVDDVRTEGALTFEGSHQRADGTIVPVEVNFNHVALDREYMCAIARDVTERKEHERELEERNERLERFASMLAHELRNPVTIGQIYSQQLPADADAEAVEYVTDAFDRIEDMIDVILVLTRGREAVGEQTPVQLADMARAAWDEVDAPEATFEVGIDHTIQADETYIRHLFRNLFENAVEHGGADVTVTVGELPTGFYVADDGTGISADDRDAVFEAGYTTAAGQGGTGLGLAYVKELADVYEWECTVTESATDGVRFEFTNVDQTHSKTDQSTPRT